MPCTNSSSQITLKLDGEGKFVSFDFARITCGRPVNDKTGYSRYCIGRTLQEILDISFSQAVTELELIDEEERFILFLEQAALQAAIAQFFGIENKEIDKDRCHIISIEHHTDGTEIALLILPPKEMPKILPCHYADSS